MKILTVIGARPQFIKAAMVSRAFKKANDEAGQKIFEELILHTGQHYDEKMSRIFFEQLGLPAPTWLMELGGGSHGQMTGRMLAAIEEILEEQKPGLVLVYGDTNSTLAGALAAAKLHLPVAHVEAGLRSFNRTMPEEINRVLTDHLACLHFCPTRLAVENLAQEGLTKGVSLAGDVMYDAALFFAERAHQESTVLKDFALKEKEFYLVTIHRQENTDKPERLNNLRQALAQLAIKHPVLWPVHPRLKDRLAKEIVPPGLIMCAPLAFLDMMRLEIAAKTILTDSGGVQKEAYFHQTPCVTLRDETEWQETVEAGWNQLAGCNQKRILELAASASPGRPIVEYGQGRAAEDIVAAIKLWSREVL